MQAVVRPHPLSNRERILTDIDFGMTIAETVDRLEMVDSKVRRNNLAVLIDGETVPREFWHQRRLLKTDSKVEFAAVLHGGGAKSILGTIAMIALTIYTGGLAAGAFGGIIEGGLAGTSLLVAKAGIMLVGSLLIHSIFAPPRTNPSGGGDAASPTYTFSGQSNQPRKYAPLPRIYGKHRYVADIAAMPYTTTVGPDQYLYAIYSFGYGPLKLDDFRVGENPLTNYTDYSVNVIENFTDPSQLKIYKSDVWQDSVSFELSVATPVTVTTQTDAQSAGLDISFPQGLATINNDGNFETLATNMVFEYRALGSANWLPLDIQKYSHGAATTDVRFTMSGNGSPGITAPNDGRQQVVNGSFVPVSSPGWPTGTRVFTGKVPINQMPTAGMTLVMGYFAMTIESVVDQGDSGGSIAGLFQRTVQITTTDGLPGNLTASPGDDNLICVYKYFAPDAVSSTGTNELNMNDKTQTSITISLEFDFPQAGQYEIRITKTDIDFQNTDRQHLWRRYVTAVRTFKNAPPIAPEVPITIVELAIKATGQLNGTIDQFSAVCSSVLRAWVNGGWVQQVTSNPAWVYLDILTGTANNRPLADSRIDMDAIRAWAVKCDAVNPPFVGPMGTCDVVVDRPYTVWELLQNVASTGRGSPTMKDNKYSILVDSDDRQPVQMFTPRNSRNVKVKRSFLDEPDAFRVKWIDALNNYQEAETVIYNAGKDFNTTTVFEDLQAFGITRGEQALRWGRYMLAQAKLRQEHVTLETDIENIVCVRGDKVLLATDVLELGGMAVRIIDVEGFRIFVDAPSILPDQYTVPDDFGIRIRGSDGFIGPVLSIAGIGVSEGLDYIDVTPDTDLTGVIADNLLVMGPKAEVVGEYVVDSVSPGADLAATIGLEEYAPAVFTAEYTGIEQLVYVPQGGAMNAPGVFDLAVSTRVLYDAAGRPMVYVRASWRRAQGTNYKPDEYRVWQLTPDGKEQYLGATHDLYWELPAIDAETLNGYVFIFRVRPFYGQLGIGPVAEASAEIEYIPGLAPQLIDFFNVTDIPGGMRRYEWRYNGPVPQGVTGIQVRTLAGNVVNPVWNDGEDIITVGNYAIPTGFESHNPVGTGTFTFMARTVDNKNRLSDGTYVLIKDVSGTQSIDLSPPPTPTGFVAFGGHNIVVLEVDQPVYSVGGGHQYTQVYTAKITAALPNPTFADATPFTSFTDIVGSVAVESATSYRFWAKWVSQNNTISQNPAGPVDAASSIDVAATLTALTGAITDTQLDQELTTSITGGNGNSVQNSEVAVDTSGWTLTTSPANDANFSLNRNLTGGWFIPGSGVGYIKEALGYTVSRAGYFAETYIPNSIPVVPGKRYQASAYTGSHRSATNLYVNWYDVNGALLSTSAGDANAQNNAEKAGGTTLAGYKRVFLFAVAPANAVTAKISLRKYATDNSVAGAVDSYLFFTMVMFTTARANQTVPDPYVPGPLSNAQTQAIVTNTTSVSGLNAQYTVKADVNGYVTGFGFATTTTSSAPLSVFAVRSDSFYVANPTGPSIAPSMPFIVRTTATVINGQNVPVGVYMAAAYIQNGTIDSAKIGLAVITDAHIASLNADKINAGTVKAGNIDSRGLTIKDAAGNVIFSSGTSGINFSTALQKFLNYAPSISRPGWTYSNTDGVTVGSRLTGSPYAHDGWYLYLPGTTGNYELWAAPAAAYPAQTVLVSFYAYVAGVGSRGMNVDIFPAFAGGGVTLTQFLTRYSIQLPKTAAGEGSSQLRFIGLVGSLPIVVHDVQVEVYIGNPNPTSYKQNVLDVITPANPLSPANVGTFIAAATIQGAHIGQATIVNANIAALAVDTLQLAGNAVTVPLSVNAPGSYYLSTASQVIAETGYGYFSIAGNVTVTAIGTFDGSVAVTLYAVCSDGAVLSSGLFTDNGAGSTRTPGGVPAAYMFTLDRPGSWKFQMRAYSLSSQTNPAVSTFYYGATLTAMGVKK